MFKECDRKTHPSPNLGIVGEGTTYPTNHVILDLTQTFWSTKRNAERENN